MPFRGGQVWLLSCEQSKIVPKCKKVEMGWWPNYARRSPGVPVFLLQSAVDIGLHRAPVGLHCGDYVALQGQEA